MDQQNQYSNSDFTPRPPATTNGYAVAALILGLVAIVFLCCCFPVSPVAAILSIVFAAVSKREGTGMNGQATVGMVLSIVALVLVVVLVVFMAVGFANMSDEDIKEFYDWYYNYIENATNQEGDPSFPDDFPWDFD